jgi:hypothetical protein
MADDKKAAGKTAKAESTETIEAAPETPMDKHF